VLRADQRVQVSGSVLHRVVQLIKIPFAIRDYHHLRLRLAPSGLRGGCKGLHPPPTFLIDEGLRVALKSAIAMKRAPR